MSLDSFYTNMGRVFGFHDDAPSNYNPSESAFWYGGSKAASDAQLDALKAREGAWSYQVNNATSAGVYDPTQANADAARAQQDRAALGDVARQYQAVADGQGGPSQAELAMREGTARAQASAQSMAASAKGVAPGAALRMALGAQGSTAADSTNAAAQLRAKEIADARAGVANTVNAQAGLDSTMRGQSQAQAAAAAQVAEQERERAAGMSQAYLAAGTQQSDQQLKAKMQFEDENRQARADVYGAQQTAYGRQASGLGGLVSGAAGAAVGFLGSDERIKTDIAPTTTGGAAGGASGGASTPTSTPASSRFGAMVKGFADGMRNDTPSKATAPQTDGAALEQANQKTGAALAGLGNLLSDEREKTAVHPMSRALGRLLDSIEPVEYRYKDPANGPGQHVGVIAQDLERTPAGASMVVDTPEGKKVDGGHAAAAALAAAADHNRRLRGIEKLLGIEGGS